MAKQGAMSGWLLSVESAQLVPVAKANMTLQFPADVEQIHGSSSADYRFALSRRGLTTTSAI